MKAGRETDALVAEKVMGWANIRVPPDDFRDPETGQLWEDLWGDPPGSEGMPLAHYSTDIASAWEVVEKLRADFFPTVEAVGYSHEQRWEASFWDGASAFRSGWADTAPLAICIAALRAVGADVEENE